MLNVNKGTLLKHHHDTKIAKQITSNPTLDANLLSV